MTTQWNGSSGTPIQLRTHAPRQTEAQGSPRLNRTRQRTDVVEEENDDAWTVEKPHTSAYRYDLPAPKTGKTTTWLPPKPTQVLPSRRFRREHLILWCGLAMLVMLLGFVALSWLASWWTTQTNDWTYGRPRTYQTDHVVGHNDGPTNPSHFLAMNLNRHVLVIEFPGGDPSKAVTYLGPVLLGDGQDLIPVTLSFEDRNGDGKPDLNIHIGDQVIVFLNENGKFVAPQQH
jgi:hypothetical protein